MPLSNEVYVYLNEAGLLQCGFYIMKDMYET